MTDHDMLAIEARKVLIKADFVKPQPVPSRKVLQLVFEVPEEQADHAMAVLGGYPQSGQNRWCAIAQLDPEITPAMIGREAIAQLAEDGAGDNEQPSEATTERVKGGDRARRAGRYCNDATFQHYMKCLGPPIKCFPPDPPSGHMSKEAANARDLLLKNCFAKSMRHLDHDDSAGEAFDYIEQKFHAAQEGRTDEDQQRQREAGRT